MGKTVPVRSVRQKKKIRKPMSKKMKIILSCVISAVLLTGAIIGLVLGLTKNRSVFYYLKLEQEVGSETYTIKSASKKLKGKVVIPETYKGKKITKIDDKAFYKSNITSIILPDSITSFGVSAFAYSQKLEKVKTPANLEVIGQSCFVKCEKLKSFEVSEATKDIGSSAFNSCESISSIVLKNNVENIQRGAFRNCKSLTTITIPASVTNIGGPLFTYCNNLVEIKVEEGNTAYSSFNGSNCLVDLFNNNLISGCKTSVIPDGVKSIGESSFEGVVGLTSINFPASVETIKNSAFYGCSGLGTEDDYELELLTITYVEPKAFHSCAGLKKVTLGGVLDIPEDNDFSYGGNEDACIPSSMFTGCKNLKEVTISAPSVKALPLSMFSGCKNLETVNIENSLEIIGSNAFDGCEKLVNITLPTSLDEICSTAFGGCVLLTEVYIPESVTIIEDYAFFGCSDSLVLKMQTTSKLEGYSEKFDYYSETKRLTVEWGVTL